MKPILLLWAGLLATVAGAAERSTALSPAEALATLQHEAGVRVELVASEPMVISPVAFAFDERRRLYVVEDRGYPDPLDNNIVTHDGRVVLLEDTHHNGVYDKATPFATGLSYPNGIMCWKGGVFVTCAPDIYFLKDTKGDGVADVKQVVLTGFDATKSAQIRTSHPTLGLDGMIYVTSGLNGGHVTSPLHPERAPVVFTPMDGRFDPETFVFENTGGRGQFGLSFDAFGRRFVCSNRRPVEQIVMEPWQLKRNPYLGVTETVQEVSNIEWAAKVVPVSGSRTTADFFAAAMNTPHTGTFTSACGLLIYGGTGLSPEHNGNAFICEPAQNLMQRQILRPVGATFHSERADPTRDFLASTDTWFRPVFAGSGPDGGLYVADMYRQEIDHPLYLPEELRDRLDFNGGKDRGRIYRVVDEAAPKFSGKMELSLETPEDWCRALASADAWWQATAFRLLFERKDPATAPLLRECLTQAKTGASRVRALWLLYWLHDLPSAALNGALHDPDPGVRENAVRLVGKEIEKQPELIEPLLAAARDDDARVRFSAALVLGPLPDPRVVAPLAAIAVRDGEDPWARAAVLSGMGTRMPEFLAAIMAAPSSNVKAYGAVMEDLGRVFGAGASLSACQDFFRRMVEDKGELAWRLHAVLGLAAGVQRRAEFKRKDGARPLGILASAPDAAAEGTLENFLAEVAKMAADNRAITRDRASAAALLGYGDFAAVAPRLAALLEPSIPPEIQLQAVQALTNLGPTEAGQLMVRPANWSAYSPQVREAVVTALCARPDLTAILFEAIKGKVISAAQVSPAHRTQLLQNANATIKQGAADAFKDLESGDRMKVYQAYRPILALPEDPAHGREVFMRVCSGCHAYEGTGGKVGPDLSGMRNQPSEALLLHIIVPNYEVAPTYQMFSATLRDGPVVAGYITSENETSLTLRTPFGTDETIMRKNLVSLAATGLSPMPDGLEQTITKQDLRSVIAFIKSGAAPLKGGSN